jgi:Holliday junction resolvasome RuvABC DNA-binding subunit
MKNDPFAMVQRATKKAFQRVGKVSGVEPDPDLKLYSTLKPEHFTKLMKIYDEDTVINYIRDMESQMIMGGKKTNG